MDATVTAGFLRYFQDLADPRRDYLVRHKLSDILIIAILAVICGAEDWASVAQWGCCKAPWLATFLELPEGIPSHDTFARVFSRIDPDAFERCFTAWMQGVCEASQGRLVAIDGKSLRRSFRHGWDKSGMAHLVSAMVSQADNRLVFSQVAVKGKSNEITAIPELLKLLNLQEAVVTIDAIGTQRAITQQIIEQGGDYVLPVKDNQKALLENVESVMTDLVLDHQKGHPSALSVYEQTDEAHGRREVRKLWFSNAVELLRPQVRQAWPGLGGMALVQRERQNYGDFTGQTSVERCFYITSLRQISAERLAGYIRGHWAVENNLHWILDVAFREDQQRMRVGFAAENHSRLNRIALNLLKREKSVKLGVKNKRLLAGWDNNYLLRLISQ